MRSPGGVCHIRPHPLFSSHPRLHVCILPALYWAAVAATCSAPIHGMDTMATSLYSLAVYNLGLLPCVSREFIAFTRDGCWGKTGVVRRYPVPGGKHLEEGLWQLTGFIKTLVKPTMFEQRQLLHSAFDYPISSFKKRFISIIVPPVLRWHRGPLRGVLFVPLDGTHLAIMTFTFGFTSNNVILTLVVDMTNPSTDRPSVRSYQRRCKPAK